MFYLAESFRTSSSAVNISSNPERNALRRQGCQARFYRNFATEVRKQIIQNDLLNVKRLLLIKGKQAISS